MLLGAGFGIICPMKLSEYIGETSSYDKKLMLERDNPLSWLKSVSAFANTMGGKLLFGVSDDGELVGLVNAEKDAEYISEAIKTQIDPIPQTKLSIHEEGGKRFVVVEVGVGGETPYYLRHKGSLTAGPIRRGSGARRSRVVSNIPTIRLMRFARALSMR